MQEITANMSNTQLTPTIVILHAPIPIISAISVHSAAVHCL